MLHGLEVYIVHPFKLPRQVGQFKIMGGKQGVGFYLACEVFGHRPGECKTVVGAGSASDFIHQHQGVLAGAMQNIGGLRHLHHEGRAPPAQVITGADPCKDSIQWTDNST